MLLLFVVVCVYIVISYINKYKHKIRLNNNFTFVEYKLGPILFLIYINDLEDDISSKVLKFADDTKVFR